MHFRSFSGDGRHFRRVAARPSKGRVGSATGDNDNFRQRKRSSSAAEGGRHLFTANQRVPHHHTHVLRKLPGMWVIPPCVDLAKGVSPHTPSKMGAPSRAR